MIIYLFAAISLLLSAAALYFVIDTVVFRMKARELPARVIGYETKISDNSRFFYPVTQYRDGGRTFRLRSAIGSGTVPFRIGEDVTVLVLKQMHATARIRQRSRFIIALLLAILGAGFIAPLLIETDHAVTQWYLPAIALIATVLEWFTLQWQGRKDNAFDYTPGEDGVIGHRPDHTFQDNPESLHPPVITKKVRFVTLLLGMGILGGAAWLYDHEAAFLAGASSVPGKVVALKSHRDEEGTLLYAPKVRFSPRGGNHFDFTSNMSSSHPGYKVGDTVTVLYDPDDPTQAQIDRGVWNHIVSMGLAAVGFLMTFVSAAALLRRRET